MEHHRLIATSGSFGWIQKYIFPGGLIPSLQSIHEVTRDRTDLRVERVQAFGGDYAETLRRWRETFLDAVAEHQRPGLRRDLPPDVGVLPRLL